MTHYHTGTKGSHEAVCLQNVYLLISLLGATMLFLEKCHWLINGEDKLWTFDNQESDVKTGGESKSH